MTKTFTYQARITGQQPVLDAFARLFGRLERKFYVDRVHRTTSINELKSHYIADYGITARQFNSLRISVDGKVSSVIELLKLAVSDYQVRITQQQAKIKKLLTDRKKEAEFLKRGTPENRRLKARQSVDKMDFVLHQRKRRLATLIARKERIEQRIKDHNPKLCFGSKKLFRSQFALDEQSLTYKDELQAWKKAWQQSRNHDIYLVGSKDESCGNQSCQGVLQDDGRLQLTVRLPNALHKQFGKTFVTNVKLNYGQRQIVSALNASRSEVVKKLDADGKEVQVKKRTGVALTYRFSKDAKGWRVLISVPVTNTMKTEKQLGVIGIDLNADHLAATELDRFGNMIAFKRYPLNLTGTSDQNQALIGDTVKDISSWAKQASKPIVLEALDFKAKKQAMGDDKRYNVMLSSLAYNQIHQMMSASAFRAGVEVITVNPAYTSVIGNINYAKRLGISGHLAASIAIGRRGMNLKENPVIDAQGQMTYVLRDGHCVALSSPVRKRDKHVWSLWSKVRSQLTQPQEAGYRWSRDRAAEQRQRQQSPPMPIVG
jgi:IS605 OrfB family transposase